MYTASTLLTRMDKTQKTSLPDRRHRVSMRTVFSIQIRFITLNSSEYLI